MAIQTLPRSQTELVSLRARKTLGPSRGGRYPPRRQSAALANKVLDIGGSTLPKLLNELVHQQLIDPEDDTRHLPALFFSDDEGLEMWSEITHLPDYYQTRDEIDLLHICGDEIVHDLMADSRWDNGMTVFDLGAGNIRKVVPLLHKLDAVGIPIRYYALDLSRSSLLTAMSTLEKYAFKNVKCYGIWGAFDHAITFIQSFPVETPRIFMSLGSMFGNDFENSAISLLDTWRRQMRPHDRMLIGMDGTTDLDDIWNSYHDGKGLFERFITNGFLNSNKVIGKDWYRPPQWKISGRLVTQPHVMHRFILTAKEDIFVLSEFDGCERKVFFKNQEIECYRAFKLSVDDMVLRFARAGLVECCPGWQSAITATDQYLLRASEFA